jgi:hypothetical protein
MSWSRASLDESPAQRKAKRVAQTQHWRASNPGKVEAYKARRAEIDRLRKRGVKIDLRKRGAELPPEPPVEDNAPRPVTLPLVAWLLRTTGPNARNRP